MRLLAEAPPLAPAIPAALLATLGLVAFLGYLVATGTLKVYSASLGALIRYLADKIDVAIGAFGHSVHPFRFLKKGLLYQDHLIRSALGALQLVHERVASWAFSTAGIILRWTGREIGDLARDTLSALQRTATVDIPSAIRDAQASLLSRLRGIDATVGRLEALAKAQLRRLQHGIDRLERIATRTIPRQVHALAARVGLTARQLRRMARRLSHVERLLGTAAFTAAVALALTRVLGPWIRCPSLKSAGRKIGCRGFSFLDDLLSLSFTAVLATDLCAITSAMQKAAQEAVPALNYLAEHIPALLACQKATRPKALKVRWYEPPPVVTSLEL